MPTNPPIKLGQLISQIEAQAGTSITDPRLLEADVMLMNLEPTSHAYPVVMLDGVAGPVVYLTAAKPLL